MGISKAVKANAGHQLIVNERTLALERGIAFLIVPIDRQNLTATFFNRHDIRQRNTILILIAFKIQVGINLIDLVLFCAFSARLNALNTINLCLNRRLIRIIRLRITDLNVAIHASQLRQTKVPARHWRYVAVARACFQIRRAIRNDKIIRQNKPAHRASQHPILIYFLERRAHQSQPEQHLVELFVELRRQFRKVKVHEILNP